VKNLKDGQRSHLLADKVAMQATVFGAASAERVKLEQRFKAKEEIVIWEDADLDKLGLNRYGIDVAVLTASTVPIRKYNCWTEDWKRAIILVNDLEHQAKFLCKYGGICFANGDESYVIHSGKMYFQKQRGQSRYCVLACKDIYETEDENDTPEEAKEKAMTYDIFDIDDDLHGLIYEFYRANPDPKICCIAGQSSNLEEDGEWNNWVPEAPKPTKKKSARPKR
jgi:hypothetical protein